MAKLAAQNGDVEAEYELAHHYENILDNPENALIWYNKAAEQGHKEAAQKAAKLEAKIKAWKDCTGTWDNDADKCVK